MGSRCRGGAITPLLYTLDTFSAAPYVVYVIHEETEWPTLTQSCSDRSLAPSWKKAIRNPDAKVD